MNTKELTNKIRQYLRSRYEARLSHKLVGRHPVNLLVLPSVGSISDESAQNLMILNDEDVRGTIGDIFTQANGRLMLIGLPGSGKTTLVLQLALHLMERHDSIPVVLNLATWRTEFQTFEDWIQETLPVELGVSTRSAELIWQGTSLVLLLDGLDEVPISDRNSLITEIGKFGVDANQQFLISSRSAEYAETKDAAVYAQVEVSPLTTDQVKMSIVALSYNQPEGRKLFDAIQKDQLFLSTLVNPFYLNTAQLLFATGENWSDFNFKAANLEGLKQELVALFVDRQLAKKGSRSYNPEKAKRWLSFLASRMSRENLVTFELRDLQPNWIKISISTLFFFFFGNLFFIWLVYILPDFQLNWLILLITLTIYNFFIYIFIRIPDRIITTDKWRWSWSGFKLYLKISVITVLFFGLSLELIIYFFSDRYMFGLGLLISLYINVFILIFLGVFRGRWFSKHDLVVINSPYKRLKNSLLFLNPALIKHLALRIVLYLLSLMPLRLVNFLNEMALRSILEFDGDAKTGKGGGVWRFRHRILQDYFTEQWNNRLQP